ncbi:MAG: hypothetical protein ACERKZ_19135 [Lachnotalea sp.]
MISLVLALPFTIIAKTVGFNWETDAYKENLLEGLWTDSNHSSMKEGTPASKAAKTFAIIGPIALVIQTRISVGKCWSGAVAKVPKTLSIFLLSVKSILGLLVASSWITPLVFSNTQSDQAVNISFIVMVTLPVYFDVLLSLLGCFFDANSDEMTIINSDSNMYCDFYREQKAITDAQGMGDSTVTLMKDAATENMVTINSGTFTINLNNKTWTYNKTVTYFMLKQQSLGEITITNGNTTGGVISQLGGTLIIGNVVLSKDNSEVLSEGTLEVNSSANAIDKELTFKIVFWYRNIYPMAIEEVASGNVDIKGIVVT